MDIEKLIERLEQYSEDLIAYKLGCNFADACTNAVIALSALQAENEKLRAELEQTRKDCAVAEKNHADCIGELEKVKQEKESLLKYAADMGECCLCTYDSFCPTDNPMFGDCEECEKSRKCPCITCSETKNWQWRGAEKG